MVPMLCSRTDKRLFEARRLRAYVASRTAPLSETVWWISAQCGGSHLLPQSAVQPKQAQGKLRRLSKIMQLDLTNQFSQGHICAGSSILTHQPHFLSSSNFWTCLLANLNAVLSSVPALQRMTVLDSISGRNLCTCPITIRTRTMLPGPC